ncbi:oligopeptide transport system permease protein [Bacillus thermophilus]|uniref:Oligopeptide transport system permease protein n=1 Tax=Siminovitchia thermophila TaxID=1245522 RepID=A0ABS2R8E0_9BACI|nr:oligopeptide ABC transporter permease [Siminovitchia thermophila]MBM7714856.1 oligopeptide transport system permease protein [Siminovitchia thermophila]ONK21741.1 peptide ABC transporter permease [Bacillus sp. VT-16-64]
MKKYIASRLGYMALTFLLITTFTFFLMQTLPGSPFNDERLTPEQKEVLYERYGLNEPMSVQYVKYVSNIIKGDFGVSFQFDGRPVTSIIGERIGVSAVLGAQSLAVGTIIGLLLGIVAAIRHNTVIDYGAMVVAVLGLSIPNFVLAGLLQYWVGVRLQWLPVAFWEGFEYSILPTIALAAFVVATIARFMRTEMLEVLGHEYMTTARAKGVGEVAVIFRHGLRNAMIPIITIMGPLTVSLMTGTLVVEKIFSVPGLGEQFVKSILTNDYPVIMGVTLFYSFLFILAIFIVDLLYGVMDPRIRLSGGGRK